MILFPAIDLKDKKVVRLTRGDYNKVTVYETSPEEAARGFLADGAEYLHVVDLDGAKDGTNPNFDVIASLARDCGLKIEVGGGIRDDEVIDRYLNAGVMRVILVTAAVTNHTFLKESVRHYGDRIAVGVDISEGHVATHGWTKSSGVLCDDFCAALDDVGVKTVICTDISKDGALAGTNLELYRHLSSRFKFDIIASGGVSSLDDVRALCNMNLYGAILGKALYSGKINLVDALEVCQDKW